MSESAKETPSSPPPLSRDEGSVTPERITTKFIRCGYCHTWNTRPCGEQCAWDPSGEPFTEVASQPVREERQPQNDGNTFRFCDHVERVDIHDYRGCIRGAGHDGPHVFNQRHINPPLAPVVLKVGSVSDSSQRSKLLTGQERSAEEEGHGGGQPNTTNKAVKQSAAEVKPPSMASSFRDQVIQAGEVHGRVNLAADLAPEGSELVNGQERSAKQNQRADSSSSFRDQVIRDAGAYDSIGWEATPFARREARTAAIAVAAARCALTQARERIQDKDYGSEGYAQQVLDELIAALTGPA